METTSALVELFTFNLWANLRLLEACAGLDGTALDAALPGTFGSIGETLVHLIAAEERYVTRFTGQLPAHPLRESEGFPGFAELRRRARAGGDGLIAIAACFAPGQTLQLTYAGQTREVPAVNVLIQAINHGGDHRSQIATILSQRGVTPPEVDGWAYLEAQTPV